MYHTHYPRSLSSSPDDPYPWSALPDYPLPHVPADFNYTPLAYPESSQRTFISESSLANACHIPLSSASGQQVLPQRLFEEHDAHTSYAFYRAENQNPIYVASMPDTTPYDVFANSLHEYDIQHLPYSQRDDCSSSPSSPAMENMLQVFSLQHLALTHAVSPPGADVNPSTRIFQLGPHSLEQVEDLESSATSFSYHSTSDVAEDDSDLWEESNTERQRPPSPSPSIQRSGTPLESESQATLHDGSKRSGRKPIHSSSKRSKMHQCKICEKWFPRPSGLATHMNSHSGLRPFNCPLATCNKSFAVRSNAKRHLRTHGIIPSPESHKSIKYSVGFDTPLVTEVHESSETPPMLRWVPQSLTSWTNLNWSKSVMDSESDGEDGYPTLPVPLPPVAQKDWNSSYSYDERNSYDESASQPYHPRHWRGLPGPAFA